MQKSLFAEIAAFLMLSFALAGCTAPGDGGDDSQASQDKGTVAFYVKDAPVDDFESVYVTFNKVEVHLAGAGDDDTDELGSNDDDDLSSVDDDDLSSLDDEDLSSVDDDDLSSVDDDEVSGVSSWITIVDSSKTLDLLDYQGDARAFLGNEDIAEGRYTQIRIHVTDLYGILADGGERVDFKLPGGTLKIVRPWVVEEGEATILTVDFDLEKSIKMAGQSYRMQPVLKLTIEQGDKDELPEDGESDPTDSLSTADSRGGKPTDKGNASHGPPTNKTNGPK